MGFFGFLSDCPVDAIEKVLTDDGARSSEFRESLEVLVARLPTDFELKAKLCFMVSL